MHAHVPRKSRKVQGRKMLNHSQAARRPFLSPVCPFPAPDGEPCAGVRILRSRRGLTACGLDTDLPAIASSAVGSPCPLGPTTSRPHSLHVWDDGRAARQPGQGPRAAPWDRRRQIAEPLWAHADHAGQMDVAVIGCSSTIDHSVLVQPRAGLQLHRRSVCARRKKEN